MTSISSLDPYPSLSFYVPPPPTPTPISSRPKQLSSKPDSEQINLIHLLRQNQAHPGDHPLLDSFNHETLSNVLSKVEKLIGFNVFSAVYHMDHSVEVEDVKDIKLQSEAGQTHLLRISSRDDGPTIFSSLKVEYDLHQWLSSLGLGTTLPFDRPIGSSWSEGEGEAAMGDGLTWSLYQVRASNASIGYGWESLKDDQKFSLLQSLTKTLYTLHSQVPPQSIISTISSLSSSDSQSLSVKSYIEGFLSSILELDQPSPSQVHELDSNNIDLSQRERGRESYHRSDDDSLECGDSSNRSDSAIAGLGTSPETYRNSEIKGKMMEKEKMEMEKRREWLNKILERFPEEKEVGEKRAHLILDPKDFFSTSQILINSPSVTSFKPISTRIVSLRPFRSEDLISRLQISYS